jgi:hypothetical protein
MGLFLTEKNNPRSRCLLEPSHRALTLALVRIAGSNAVQLGADIGSGVYSGSHRALTLGLSPWHPMWLGCGAKF